MNAAILMAVLTAMALTAVPAVVGHDAGFSNDHGILTAEGNPGACRVDIEWREKDFRGVIFRLILEDGTIGAEDMKSLGPAENQTTWLEVSPEVAPQSDLLELDYTRSGGGGQHTALAEVEPFECVDHVEACPPDLSLSAVSHDDESVTVEADGLDGEAGLERALAGTDDFEHIATLDEGNTTFRDTGTEAQTTYEYRLMMDGETCATVEVTAIPVFPGLIVASLATVAGLGAYGAIARRGKD